MAYSAIAVANAFIEKAQKKGINDLSPMKLQKLVYFAHAWMLAITGEPLISEPVKAWKFGPVIDSIYHEFKSYGSKNITTQGTEFAGFDSDDVFDQGFIIPKISKSDERANAIIDAIIETYGERTAVSLSNLTHEPDSPWCVTQPNHKSGSVKGYIIPNDIILNKTREKLGLDS